MASPDPASRISDQAAIWAARSIYGDMTDESRIELEAWLACDHRHRGAYLRAQAAAITMEDAVTHGRPLLASDNDNGAIVEELAPPHERRWGAIAACLAVLLLAAVPMWRAVNPQPSRGIRTMALADGSRAELDDGARISVAMSDSGRRITLLEGQANFHVAKDASRPFVVRSGNVYAQATGTIYSVRRLGAVGGVVHVTEGKVLVWAGDEQNRAVLLRAGGSLSLDPGNLPPPSPEVSKASPVAAPPAEIAFDDVPITTAVARFNRAQSLRHIAVDPGLADVKLIGLFRIDKPEQFARAAATISGGHVELHGNRIFIRQ